LPPRELRCRFSVAAGPGCVLEPAGLPPGETSPRFAVRAIALAVPPTRLGHPVAEPVTVSGRLLTLRALGASCGYSDACVRSRRALHPIAVTAGADSSYG